MKSTLILAALILLASCGRTHNASQPLPQAPADASILSQFINTNTSSKLPSLDFRLLTIGTAQDSGDVLNCDGTFGNAGFVNGVDQGNVLALGNEQSGTIQFSHTKYVGASNPTCRAVSKESYTYSITGTTLSLCNINCINGVYPSCQANPCETFNKL